MTEAWLGAWVGFGPGSRRCGASLGVMPFVPGEVVATSLLALRYFRAGVDDVAAGFLVFAIGEGVLLSGTAAGPAASVPAFAAGTALWAGALALISAPPRLQWWPIRSSSRRCWGGRGC